MIPTLIIGSLAVWQVILIWNHSELFATRRAYVEANTAFFSRLLSCSFCLSNWVSAFLVSTLAVSELLTRLQPHFPECVWIPVASVLAYIPSLIFAVARIANVSKDLFRSWDRTPRYTTILNIKADYDESEDAGTDGTDDSSEL